MITELNEQEYVLGVFSRRKLYLARVVYLCLDDCLRFSTDKRAGRIVFCSSVSVSACLRFGAVVHIQSCVS